MCSEIGRRTAVDGNALPIDVSRSIGSQELAQRSKFLRVSDTSCRNRIEQLLTDSSDALAHRCRSLLTDIPQPFRPEQTRENSIEGNS